MQTLTYGIAAGATSWIINNNNVHWILFMKSIKPLTNNLQSHTLLHMFQVQK
jgi:hypothetical protein